MGKYIYIYKYMYIYGIYIYMEYIYIGRISRGFSWDIANFMRGSGDLSIKNSDLE